jgi:hypothetical protein
MSDIYTNEAIGDLRRTLRSIEVQFAELQKNNTNDRLAELEKEIEGLRNWNSILASLLEDRDATLTTIKTALGITESETTTRLRKQLAESAAVLYTQQEAEGQ